MHERKARAAEFLPAVLLLGVGLAALCAAWSASGRGSGQYLVVAPPDTSLAASINLVRAAGGSVLGTGALPNMIVAGSAQEGFTTTLRKTGAWFAIPVPRIAGCEAAPSQEQAP
ncbi:hypothetical protein [Novosphingobium soli]|uniref:hypothetical protein n=1 Tax=Novosphingobium soli TaxID=574956 RepID=UPI0036D33C38